MRRFKQKKEEILSPPAWEPDPLNIYEESLEDVSFKSESELAREFSPAPPEPFVEKHIRKEPEEEQEEKRPRFETIENIWIDDSLDFIPSRQSFFFDEFKEELVIVSASGVIRLDHMQTKRDPSKMKPKTQEETMSNAEIRKYYLLSRENKEKFIVTKYLTNIKVDDIVHLRDTHVKIMRDFMPHLEDDIVLSEEKAEYVTPAAPDICEEIKAVRNGSETEVLLVVVFKERLGAPSFFKTLPTKFEVKEEIMFEPDMETSDEHR